MNYQFSQTSTIAPSATLEMNSKAAALKASGVTVHNLSVGEAMVPTDPVIIAAAEAALEADHTNYTPGSGITELRNAWRNWMETEYHAVYDISETTITAGGKHAILLLLQTLLNSGDEVIIPAPYWVSYPSMVHVAGGVANIVPTTNTDDWKLRPEQFRAAITKQTRVLILNSAGNPTGTVYRKEELSELLEIAAMHNIMVISDEVYSSLVYDGGYTSCGTFEAYRNIVCVVQSMSKHFAMTGWRVGSVFAPVEISKRVQTLQGQSTSGAASISQYAAVAALTDAERISGSNRSMLRARRDAMVRACGEYGITMAPAASGLYQFVPISMFGATTELSVIWCTEMLEQGHVACVPGAAFGTEGYVRLSFGGSIENIQQAVYQLCKNI